MGNYRRDNDHGNKSSRGGFNRDRGNRGRGFNRDFGKKDRKPIELHDVVCDKCKKETQVPFKPTGDKPILCRDCFKKSGGGKSNYGNGSRGKFGNRDMDRGRESKPLVGGVSSEDFKALSKKVDKILKILENVEIGIEEEEEENSVGEEGVVDYDDDDEESDYEDDSTKI